eukprot:XP_023156476.1 angiomotin-like [Zea mays]
MVAHLGLSPDPGPGQGLPCQPPSGLVPSVPKAGTSGSQSEERRQVEGAPDPSGKVAALTPGSQANPSVLQRQVLVSAAQEVDPPAAAATPRQAVPSAPRAPKVEAAPKSVAGQPLAAPAGTEARWASPQARLALVRSGGATDAAVAPSPPDVSLVPASTSAAAVADSPVELSTVPDLPVPGPEEGANAVAEVDDRNPAALAEGEPSASVARVPDVLTAGEPDALAGERSTPRPFSGGGVLIPTQRNPNEWCGQAFRFWSRGASKPLLVLNDEQEEQSQDELRFAAVPEGRACQANERLVRQSTELADLRLLCDDLRAEVAAAWAEAALARTEAQQRQLELGQAIDERDQYWNQAAQAAGWVEALEGQLAKVSARARALAVDLAMAIGSAQSAQVVASRERAWTEDLEKALNESAKVEILLPVSSSEAGPDLAEGGNGAEGAAASPVEA